MSNYIAELHSIMPIQNIPSVLQYGILSNEQAAKLSLPPISVAMEKIQEKRDSVQVPQGLKLHQYANLYFHARNPMLYTLKEKTKSLCILRVSKEVLKIKGVVLTDQNASSTYVRFLGPEQISHIDFDMVLADDWTHPVYPIYLRRKATKCAEVLVPTCVPAKLIFGAYVADESVKEAIKTHGIHDNIVINPKMFFL
jgi:hypothetical protein